MHNRFLASILFVLAATPSAIAGPAEDAALAPVHQFIDAVNKGDMKGAGAAYTQSPSIIDEFAPYHWQGPTAYADWQAAFESKSKAQGMTDPVMTLLKPTRVVVTGDQAYAVVPALYDFRLKGITIREHGTFSFALAKTAEGWRISAWGWAWAWDTH